MDRIRSMKGFRSVLMLLVAAIAIFLVSCGGQPVAKGPLYTTEQLAQIETSLETVQELRDRMLEIPVLVQKGDWNDVQAYIHGPLGELRFKMSTLARQLRPEKAQTEALQAARDVFEHLNIIDEATVTNDRIKALKNYNEALRDFDVFLNLIPDTQAG